MLRCASAEQPQFIIMTHEERERGTDRAPLTPDCLYLSGVHVDISWLLKHMVLFSYFYLCVCLPATAA